MSKWQSERSIHEMLKDTPPIRESSDSITSGTEAKFPTSRSMPFPPAYAPPDVSQNGGAGTSTLLRAGSSKLDAIRNWGVSTYKCTKQILYEKLGKSSRTVDTELEAQIEMLRETQRKYNGVLRLSGALTQQLAGAAHTQRALGEAFAELAQKSPELQNQFLYNADTQRTLTRNGETLLAALHFFNNSLNTLTNKTIEDTLLTIRQYEAARVEYDAYRSELEGSGGNPPELLLANIERHRRHYERLRDDSAVKLKLLHENRVKVMNKQLLLFHNAVSAYFSGNNVALEAAVRHFNIHLPPAAPAPPPARADTRYVRNSSFLSRDIEARAAARRPADVPPRKSSIPAAAAVASAAAALNPEPIPLIKERPPSPPRRASPPVKSPPIKSPPIKSPPIKSPPVRSSPAGDRTPPTSVVASPPSRRATPPRHDITSPPAADLRATGSISKNEDTPRTPWRESPVAKEGPARVEKLSLVTNSIDRPIDSIETNNEVTVENAQDTPTDGRQTTKSEESNGVGDKIKKFEKAAEDASATVGRLSRPGSVRGRPRTERLGSDNSREDLPPPATPFKDNVHFDLGAAAPTERPATVLERQQSLTRNVTAASVPVRWQRTDSNSADGDKIRPEPQKIIKPEFKPMPSPVDVTIRSPSLGIKIGDQFPSHGTAFRNVASPDPARAREVHKFNDDVNTQNNFKTCKFKSKEKYSVSKGSSYFTRGSEEIWLVKKKDIEEIEERVLDSFRRAGGNICMRSESMRPSSDSGQSVSFSHATMGRTKRQMYARSESLDPQWAGARAQTLKRQTSVACTCGHDKKARAKSAGATTAPAATAGAESTPRPRSRSHGDENNQGHVLDKYETLV